MTEKLEISRRIKIASLNEKELARLLKECFFKIGKELKLDESETRLMLQEIYKFHGQVYADTLNDAFSRYAACQLGDAENVRPEASLRFIGRIMKLYFKQCTQRKYITNLTKNDGLQLTGEEKFKLFVKHIYTYMAMPGTPDWVSLFEYMAATNKLKGTEQWELLTYMKKTTHAREAVSAWAREMYKI